MDDFSLFDQLRACLPCVRRPDIDSDGDDDVEAHGARGSAARPELDRLLFDSDHEATDVEADAMSLHSNVGGRSRRNKKRRRGAGKSIKIFGYDLFGRPRLPDPSPEHSEDESSALAPAAGRLNLRPGPRPRVTSSTSSAPLDLDAETLPDAAIATLASSPPPSTSAGSSNIVTDAASTSTKWAAPLTDEQIALEEEQQREKEERKARRAARRLRKQQRAEAEAEAAAGFSGGDPRANYHHGARMNGNEPDHEFEGFPGGNATLARDAVPPKFNDDEFGPWVGQANGQAHQPASNINPAYHRTRGQSVSASTVHDDDGDVYDSEEDAADAGGEYNRRSRASASASGSRSNGESSSRHSRSRGSRSQASSSLLDGSLYAARPRRAQGTSAASRSGLGPQNVPLPPSSAGSYRVDQLLPQFHPSQQPQLLSKKSRSRSSRSAAAFSHGGSSSTSQSTSIRSPAQELFPAQIPGIGVESPFGSDFTESIHGGAGDPFTADDELAAAATLADAESRSQDQVQGEEQGGWGHREGKRVRLLPNLPGLQTRFPSTGFSSGPGSANGSGGGSGSGKPRSPFVDAQGAAFARSGW